MNSEASGSSVRNKTPLCSAALVIICMLLSQGIPQQPVTPTGCQNARVLLLFLASRVAARFTSCLWTTKPSPAHGQRWSRRGSVQSQRAQSPQSPAGRPPARSGPAALRWRWEDARQRGSDRRATEQLRSCSPCHCLTPNCPAALRGTVSRLQASPRLCCSELNNRLNQCVNYALPSLPYSVTSNCSPFTSHSSCLTKNSCLFHPHPPLKQLRHVQSASIHR